MQPANVDSDSTATSRTGTSETPSIGESKAVASPPKNEKAQHASPPSVMSLFASEALPHLARAKGFVLAAGGAQLPPELSSFISKPENLSLIVKILASHGMPQGLTLPQQHALAVAVLPHLGDGTPAHYAALLQLANHAIEARDYALYKVIGDVALTMSLPPEVVFGLGKSFSTLSTHNIANEPSLKPWLELFEKKADGATYALFVDCLFSRLHEGHLSSYDHMVTALCRSQRSDARMLLESSIFPVAPSPDSTIVRSSWRMLAQVVTDSLRVALPISSAFAVVLHGFTPVALLGAGLGTIFSVALLTHRELKHAKTAVLAHLQDGVDFLDSRPFKHYAERVYQKLCKLAPSDTRNEDLLKKIELNPRYAEIIPSWRRSLVS